MKIEIGKKYEVNPVYKKCVTEIETFTGDYGTLNVTTIWRWGTWYVTPKNKKEVMMLTNAMKTDTDPNLRMYDFEEVEMRETWDGCAEDLDYTGDWTDEQYDAFQNEYYEDRWNALDKYGFESTDSVTFINCEIDVKEIQEDSV